MSELQILASDLALKIQRREQPMTECDRAALQHEIRFERSELSAAMQRSGTDNLFARDLVFTVVSCMVPTLSGYERRHGLFVRPMTNDEYTAMADAAADRLDELRDVEAEADALAAHAEAEVSQEAYTIYESEFEHARI